MHEKVYVFRVAATTSVEALRAHFGAHGDVADAHLESIADADDERDDERDGPATRLQAAEQRPGRDGELRRRGGGRRVRRRLDGATIGRGARAITSSTSSERPPSCAAAPTFGRVAKEFARIRALRAREEARAPAGRRSRSGRDADGARPIRRARRSSKSCGTAIGSGGRTSSPARARRPSSPPASTGATAPSRGRRRGRLAPRADGSPARGEIQKSSVRARARQAPCVCASADARRAAAGRARARARAAARDLAGARALERRRADLASASSSARWRADVGEAPGPSSARSRPPTCLSAHLPRQVGLDGRSGSRATRRAAAASARAAARMSVFVAAPGETQVLLSRASAGAAAPRGARLDVAPARRRGSTSRCARCSRSRRRRAPPRRPPRTFMPTTSCRCR